METTGEPAGYSNTEYPTETHIEISSMHSIYLPNLAQSTAQSVQP